MNTLLFHFCFHVLRKALCFVAYYSRLTSNTTAGEDAWPRQEMSAALFALFFARERAQMKSGRHEQTPPCDKFQADYEKTVSCLGDDCESSVIFNLRRKTVDDGLNGLRRARNQTRCQTPRDRQYGTQICENETHLCQRLNGLCAPGASSEAQRTFRAPH